MDSRVVLLVLSGLAGLSREASAADPTHISIQTEIPSAYRAAADKAGISARLLWVMAVQESGMVRGSRVVPWPWTLNIAGSPARFANREHACRALRRALTYTSAKRIDVGLVQVNWGYHQEGIRRPCELLDPYRNLAVACRFLRELHREGESWLSTAARYHRPAGGVEADRYATSLQHQLLKLEHNHLSHTRGGRMLQWRR